MSAEAAGSALCGESCPLVQLQDNEQAVMAREWAFSPPSAHEGYLDPRYPAVGMMAMHLGNLCRFRYLTEACKQEPPTGSVGEPIE